MNQNRGIFAAVIGGVFAVIAAIVQAVLGASGTEGSGNALAFNAPSENAAQDPEPAPTPPPPPPIKIIEDIPLLINNMCSRDIEIDLFWRQDGGQLVPGGSSWPYKANQRSFPVLKDEQKVRPHDGELYFSARSIDRTLIWASGKAILINNVEIDVVRANLVKSAESEFYELTLKCDGVNDGNVAPAADVDAMTVGDAMADADAMKK